MPRLACAAALLGLLIAGCGDDNSNTVVTHSQIQATTGNAVTVQRSAAVPAGNQGPNYFETLSHNIGCYLDSKSVRCDIREHDWTAPPKPQYCIKAGVDWGGGVSVAAHRASIVCAGDTTLGGPGLLGYGHSARRGPISCTSRAAGITCRNTDTDHGFFLSRARYRLF